ncbi:hypothetical protein JOF56_006926 [Kibdelosporangium banguiense]|uniref:Uncharacterized protein n=1 Tax=Kibdelosporangium banguiense TaxID=1365924 RepID=A0ABS4TQ52_9PSEU|nr:hypothetical protein [Kibdelosporangium banguiense]MBP2326541.1 hypothetical protein [Kibdelosporangium banguiense]
MSAHRVVVPRSQVLGDWSVSAELGYDPATGRTDVVVVISRAAGQPPLLAEDIDVRLLAADEQPLQVAQQPTGPLVEFGGSLGTSVNARFDFEGAEPAFLAVAAHGGSVRFRVEEAP